MRYCSRCLIPASKPYASFDEEGVCGACRAHERKNDAERGIDWAARRREFDELVAAAKAARAPYFDVLVPVSGGKDSISQVARLLEHDVRIVAVNVDYGIKTEIGRRNLALVPAMGASLFTFRPDEPLQRRLIRLGFEEYGDPDLLSHTLLHAAPLHVALRFQVPLVLLGENSAFEYGGDSAIAASNEMSEAWFDRFAANAGHRAAAIAERHGIDVERLRLYDYPPDLAESSTRAVFASYFFHWDSEENLRIAREHGFETLDHPGEGTYRNYVGIDEKINRLHQYLKLLKFGYGRATDHACEDIRNGRLSRAEAKELVRRYDLEPLSPGLAAEFAEYLGMTTAEFDDTLERYRDSGVWRRGPDGTWTIPGHLED
jgi:N-acetyl sugar amidotransferase